MNISMGVFVFRELRNPTQYASDIVIRKNMFGISFDPYSEGSQLLEMIRMSST